MDKFLNMPRKKASLWAKRRDKDIARVRANWWKTQQARRHREQQRKIALRKRRDYIDRQAWKQAEIAREELAKAYRVRKRYLQPSELLQAERDYGHWLDWQIDNPRVLSEQALLALHNNALSREELAAAEWEAANMD